MAVQEVRSLGLDTCWATHDLVQGIGYSAKAGGVFAPVEVGGLTSMVALSALGNAGMHLGKAVLQLPVAIIMSFGRLVGLDAAIMSGYEMKRVALHVLRALAFTAEGAACGTLALPISIFKPSAVSWIHRSLGLEDQWEALPEVASWASRIGKAATVAREGAAQALHMTKDFTLLVLSGQSQALSWGVAGATVAGMAAITAMTTGGVSVHSAEPILPRSFLRLGDGSEASVPTVAGLSETNLDTVADIDTSTISGDTIDQPYGLSQFFIRGFLSWASSQSDPTQNTAPMETHPVSGNTGVASNSFDIPASMPDVAIPELVWAAPFNASISSNEMLTAANATASVVKQIENMGELPEVAPASLAVPEAQPTVVKQRQILTGHINAGAEAGVLSDLRVKAFTAAAILSAGLWNLKGVFVYATPPIRRI